MPLSAPVGVLGDNSGRDPSDFSDPPLLRAPTSHAPRSAPTSGSCAAEELASTSIVDAPRLPSRCSPLHLSDAPSTDASQLPSGAVLVSVLDEPALDIEPKVAFAPPLGPLFSAYHRSLNGALACASIVVAMCWSMLSCAHLRDLGGCFQAPTVRL